jgi:hypothetical protein
MPRLCYKWVMPTFIVMPNGDAYYCCMDFGLKHYVGNMIREDYWTLVRKARIPKELCKLCYEGFSVPKMISKIIWRKHE